MNRMSTLLCYCFLIAMAFSSCKKEKKENATISRPNILFIPVDDLRPELGAYGNKIIHTPNIDKLAANGVVFNRAYVQQAVCNPSRASLLTGLRPDSIRVWDLQTDFRKLNPDVVTLPQFFKNNGYTTIGIGKTFHNIFPDSISWTKKPHPKGFPFDPDAVYASEENLAIQQKKIEERIKKGAPRDPLGFYYTKAKATENADVPDSAYFDGAQTNMAMRLLKELKNSKKPFFLSVGYYRPHLPFNAPKKYWDLYDRDELPLASNPYPPEGSPAYSVHGDQELRWYIDYPDLPLPSEKPLDEARQRKLVHGYYASVSYIDAQIGKLIKTLNELGMAENTIIVLWGDHGWKLGDHNGWAKMTNFEIDTRAPLIVSGQPLKKKGLKTDAFVEFVDIYPSLLELSNFKVPDYLAGKSFVPLLNGPKKPWKKQAYSQYLLGRFGKIKRIPGEVMGYTVRTDIGRYTEWYHWDKENEKPTELLSTEFFDHSENDKENKNLADQLSDSEMSRYHALLVQNFKVLNKTSNN